MNFRRLMGLLPPAQAETITFWRGAVVHHRNFGHLISATGHFAALPRCSIAVRFTPVSGIDSRSQALPSRATSGLPLFDYIIGALLEKQGHIEAERLGGLEVDHQLELGGCLHRQGGGAHTFQDAVDVIRCRPEMIDDADAIRRKRACCRMSAEAVYRWKARFRREANDEVAVNLGHRMGEHDKPATWPRRNHCDPLLYLFSRVDACGLRLNVEGASGCLGFVPERQMSVGLWVHENPYVGNTWRYLLQYLDPLATHRGFKVCEPSDVAARSSQIVHEATARRRVEMYAAGCSR